MAVTPGRNTGRKARTMTSESTEAANKNSRRQTAPVMTIQSRPQIDVLDHGLEDHNWHYVWVNVNDPVLVHDYYLNDYRFVRYDDVKEQLQADDRRSYLYQPDVNNRVSFGDSSRLMRIPQSVFQARMRGDNTSAASKARQAFEQTVEQEKYAGHLPARTRVTDQDQTGAVEHGDVEKVTIEEGGTE